MHRSVAAARCLGESESCCRCCVREEIKLRARTSSLEGEDPAPARGDGGGGEKEARYDEEMWRLHWAGSLALLGERADRDSPNLNETFFLCRGDAKPLEWACIFSNVLPDCLAKSFVIQARPFRGGSSLASSPRFLFTSSSPRSPDPVIMIKENAREKEILNA
jgi:hypothetical protein